MVPHNTNHQTNPDLATLRFRPTTRSTGEAPRKPMPGRLRPTSGVARPAVSPAATAPSVGALGCLRHTLRAMATQPTRNDPAAIVARCAPIVAAHRAELRFREAQGWTSVELGESMSRLADDCVLGLVHLARFWSGVRTAVAPLTVIAAGDYAARRLALQGGLDLVLLVPEAGQQRTTALAMADCLVGALRELGFEVAARIVSLRDRDERSGIALAPQARASRRHLAGAYGPYARLDAPLERARTPG